MTSSNDDNNNRDYYDLLSFPWPIQDRTHMDD